MSDAGVDILVHVAFLLWMSSSLSYQVETSLDLEREVHTGWKEKFDPGLGRHHLGVQ